MPPRVLATWRERARHLADEVAGPGDGWAEAVASTPRHLLVPAWWQDGELRCGMHDESAWLDAAYSDRTLVTSIGGAHADHASPGAHPSGKPTSSSTLPSLVVAMYRHARIGYGMDVLDVGTGSGYGTALLCQRLGHEHITSVDLDQYLISAARERLGALGMQPRLLAADATASLAGTYDRLVAMTSVRPIPASWLASLRPGGRLVCVLAGTSLILTARTLDDGWAEGRTEWDRAGFMEARTTRSQPPPPEIPPEGGLASTGRYPVLDVGEAWDVSSMLTISAPGVRWQYQEQPDGKRTLILTHPDGSWAHAVSTAQGMPAVRQDGPYRLWDLLESIQDYWLAHGELPARGAAAVIEPNGSIHLARGHWKADLAS